MLAAMQFPALGKGASPYLPLNLAPEVELQIEKLMTMTGDAPLVKPYKAKEIVNRLESIKDYHPLLYRRLSAYLKRYTQEIANTHRAVIVSGGKDNNRALENNRGVKHNANVEISAAGHVFINPYLFVSGGASYSDDGGRAVTNTHITYGNEYIQMDLGFRDHWFSPFQDSAMLMSTQAENTPSITLSNSTGLTSFNIRYELFYAQMDEDVAINANGVVEQGEPTMAGLHISAAPLENLSVGFSRTYYYGGAGRDDGLNIGVKGLFSPSSLEADLVNNNLVDNLEQGYGQTAVSAKWNYGIEIPVSVYAEFARFDSDDFNAREDSGNAVSLGIFLPVLFEAMSFRYEVTDRDEGWYESSFYPGGIRHKQHIPGHWGADELLPGISPGTTSHHVLFDWELVDDQLLNIRIAQQSFDDVPASALPNGLVELENTFQIRTRYSFVTRYGFMGVEGTFGQDMFGENYSRLSGFYRW